MRRIRQAVALSVATLALAGCGMFRQEAAAPQPMVTLRVADAALASGAPDLALRVTEVVLDKQPNNVAALVAKGDALYAMGAPDQARDAYRTAVALDAHDVGAQIGLGRTLVRSDPHAAEQHFLSALAAQPDNVVALNNLGISRDLQGHHDAAQEAYRQALAIAPEATDVKTNLGLSLALAGHGSQAVQVLQPVATAADAGPMKRADLAVAMAQEQDTGPSGPVHEQAASAATAHYDTPLAIDPAPIASVESQTLKPRTIEQTVTPVAIAKPPPAAPEQPAQPIVKPVAVRPPSPPPAPRHEAKAATGGVYVQMASLDSEQAAHSEWQHLRAHWPELFGARSPAVIEADVHNRTFWRLRTGGFPSIGEANDFCAKLRAAGSGCWTVGPASRS